MKPAQGLTPAKSTAAKADRVKNDRYQALETELRKALEADRKAQAEAMQKAIESGAKSLPAMRMGPPKEILMDFLPKFQEGAKAAGKSDDAIAFHVWVLDNGPSAGDVDAAKQALETLMGVHVKSPAMGSVAASIARAQRAIGADQVDRFLRHLEKSNPSGDVQAQAIFARVRPTLARAAVTSSEYQAARKEAMHAMDLAEDASVDGSIQGVIDGREKLMDGGIAPDIIGVDLDGVEFKLSDYKGKIVMLDFWGDW